MTLSNKRQTIAVKVESTEGTPETLTAAEATFFAGNQSYNRNITRFERVPNKDSLGQIQSLTGPQTGRVEFESELIGSGGAAIIPVWDAIVRGCGFQRYPITKFESQTITSGPLVPGNIVTQLGGKTGVIVRTADSALGSVDIYVATVAGTFDASGPVNGPDGSSFTPAAPQITEDYGFAYLPISLAIPSLTVGHFVGDSNSTAALRNQIVGARGSFGLRFETGNKIAMPVQFEGRAAAAVDVGTFPQATIPSLTPPQFLGAVYSVDFGGGATDIMNGCVNTMEINVNNDIQQRPCARQASGIESTVIVARAPSGQIDPELDLVATHDFYGKLSSSAQGVLEMEIGAPGDDKFNSFVISAPRAQYNQIGQQERAGLIAGQIDLQFNEGPTGNDELIIAML